MLIIMGINDLYLYSVVYTLKGIGAVCAKSTRSLYSRLGIPIESVFCPKPYNPSSY